MKDDSVENWVRQNLYALLAYTRTADRIVEEGSAHYMLDESSQMLAELVLRKVGDAAARLPAEFTDAHPEVPWRAMIQAREVLARHPGRIDPVLLWNTLSHKLPGAVAQVRAILAELIAGT